MRVGEICNRNVVIVEGDATVVEAAKLMRQHNVGDVLVVEGLNKPQAPIGIVTDRDIAVHVVAGEAKPESISVRDAMSFELVTASENDGVVETITLFRERKIRRIPVVDTQGVLVGILTVDDVIDLLAELLADIAKLVSP